MGLGKCRDPPACGCGRLGNRNSYLMRGEEAVKEGDGVDG